MKKPNNTFPKFKPTAFDTAEQKTKFYLQFIKFVENGMRYQDFKKWFYERLSNCFGHIAHYNQGGFWDEWFTDPASRCRFIMNAMTWCCAGSPAHTYCDVEYALQQWLQFNHVLDRYAAERDRTANARELEMLKQLCGRHPQEAEAIVKGEA